MARSDEAFKEALTGKKIPVLTLDHKWLQLFVQAQTEVPAEVYKLQERLNELLKRQGKINTQSKEILRLKKKLMNEIVELADSSQGKKNAKTDKKMEENKRLINECNEKLEAYSEELKLIPGEMENVNNKLMLISMDVCYSRIAHNTKEIEAINDWVKTTRIEMKKKMVRKDESERSTFDLYSYMHNFFGAEVIELFDLKYNPEEKKAEKDAKKAAEKESAGTYKPRADSDKTVIVDKD